MAVFDTRHGVMDVLAFPGCCSPLPSSWLSGGLEMYYRVTLAGFARVVRLYSLKQQEFCWRRASGRVASAQHLCQCPTPILVLATLARLATIWRQWFLVGRLTGWGAITGDGQYLMLLSSPPFSLAITVSRARLRSLGDGLRRIPPARWAPALSSAFVTYAQRRSSSG